MKIASVVSAGRLGIREVEMPTPGPHEALLRVDRVGICGSDIHLLPQARVGDLMGHEFAGTVVDLGPGTTRVGKGDRVCSVPCLGCGHCQACLAGDPVRCKTVRLHGFTPVLGMGAFGQYVLVGERECVKLPDSIDAARGALVEPLAVGLYAVERARIGVGETVAVLGAGPIGLAAILWVRAMGVGDIVVSDPVASRRALALKMGATKAVDPSADDVAEVCRRDLGHLPNVIIECIGRPGRFDMAAHLVGRGGRIVLAGLVESETIDARVPFSKNVSVEFVVQYKLQHFRHAVRMMADGRIDPTPMISAEIKLDALPAMMDTLMKPNHQCKVLVAPNE